MAISITVYPELSPRIIEVLAPDTEASVQDIVNAVRTWEDMTANMSYPFLIDAAGKEDLGGGVSVGITATLQNAQIAFQQRGISDSTGTVTTADSTGTVLIDSAATFIAEGIQAGDTIFNLTDSSVCTIISVDSEIQLTHFQLEDGTDNDWDSADSYKIWNKVQCEVSGGNLVAVDTNGVTISAFLPTALTHVVRTSSSSATLSDQDALQYASYGNQVSVDITSGNTGTAYPVGNQEFPVDNITDAVAIANDKGFHVLGIRSSMTGADKINSGTNLDGFKLIGKSKTSTTIEIDTSASTVGLKIEYCTVYGTMDGKTTLANCDVGIINYLNGEINNSGLFGTIYLDGAEEAVFINCYTIDQDSPPTIDMGGSGQDLAMPGYDGLVTITNLDSATEEIGIGLRAGRVILDTTTVTDGVVVISGIGGLYDELGNHLHTGTWNGSVAIYNELISTHTVQEAVWDADKTDHTAADSMGKELQDAKNKANLAASLSA